MTLLKVCLKIQKTNRYEKKQYARITLPDFPGGSETFEAAVKYCYAVKIELTLLKIAPLRCAGEVLEMTEEYW
ncbi:putative SKP1/BTB/POZ domain superfamily, NPH3/RPT2-like family protein [Helianthus debilis subsp. tardiflorus]